MSGRIVGKIPFRSPAERDRDRLRARAARWRAGAVRLLLRLLERLHRAAGGSAW
jgi:hypothetical protein